MFTFSLDILNFVISGLTLVFSLFGCRYHIWRFEAWMFTSTVVSFVVRNTIFRKAPPSRVSGYGERSIDLNKVVATFEKHTFLSQTDLTRTGIISNSFFPQNFTLGYMTKTLNQIIFFSSTKIRIFFQQHWESEYFFRRPVACP